MFDEPQAPQSVPELSKENLDICKRFLCILGIEADKDDAQHAKGGDANRLARLRAAKSLRVVHKKRHDR